MKKNILWLISVVIMALIAALALTLVMKVIGLLIPLGVEDGTFMKIFFFSACAIIIAFDVIMNRLFFTKKFIGELKEWLDKGYTMRAAFRNACNKHKIPEWLRTDQVMMKLKKNYLEEYSESHPFP